MVGLFRVDLVRFTPYVAVNWYEYAVLSMAKLTCKRMEHVRGTLFETLHPFGTGAHIHHETRTGCTFHSHLHV